MSTKKALAVFSTDWHLKKENIDQISKLIVQQCELAKKLEVEYIIGLGDVLDSRVSQREEILTAFADILDIIHSYGLKFILIPGNHDKTLYTSNNSFLTPYRHHPCLTLVSREGYLPFRDQDVYLHFLPFWDEAIWIEMFNKLKGHINESEKKFAGKQILCTHIAVTGSKNNDGTFVSSEISPKIFKDYFKVFSGHYHDQQQIGSNFYHIPSIQQNNFGENPDKGFTVLYSDGSHELVESEFKSYIKVVIDLEKTDDEAMNKYKRTYKGMDANVRFEFLGPESMLKAIKKEDFNVLGIDVKTKVKEIEDDIVFSETAEIIEHTKETIKEEFKKFCDKEKLDEAVGSKYLNKKLN